MDYAGDITEFEGNANQVVHRAPRGHVGGLGAHVEASVAHHFGGRFGILDSQVRHHNALSGADTPRNRLAD